MDDERKYSDQVEEELGNIGDVAKDIYNLADSLNNDSEGEESSNGDAQLNENESDISQGSQAEAGESKDPFSDTSEGKANKDFSNPNADVGDISDSLVGDAAMEASKDAASEFASDAVAEAASNAAATAANASAEAVGAAAGTAGGPVGVLVGGALGWAIDHIGTVVAIIAGIILAVFALIVICLGSFVPSVYDDATLAWNNRRTTESVENTKNNFLGAATTDKELAESFNQYQPWFLTFRKAASTGTVDDKWDGAYLIAAYSVYRNMYADKLESGSASKIVEVAMSQLGQHYTNTEPNPYAEYVTGVEGASGDWCQYFVSWCANQAGVGEDVIPKCGLVSDGKNFFVNKGQFVVESASYTPQAGDIIFFDYDDPVNGGGDHVGIVISADANNVYTIEGNHGDRVTTVTRSRPGNIMGYGTPAYPAGKDSTENTTDDEYAEFFSCYDEGSPTYLDDFATIIGNIFKLIIKGQEVTYEKETITPVQVPIYQAKNVKVIENGETITKQYYINTGKTESRNYESTEPEYVNVTLELEDHTIDSTTYYKPSGNRVSYTPQKTIAQETEVINSLLSKSAVLYVLEIPPDEQYEGDSGMNVTNAEYVDYLRTTMVEMLGVTDNSTTGKFIWPLDDEKYGVGVYSITDYFGYRDQPCAGASTYHRGVDISWENCRGSEVRAIASGTVVSAGSTYNVTIDHGDGYSSTYLHLDLVSVQVGQTVLQGEVIGLLGNTGISTGPHLHFEIHENGEAKDPLSFYIQSTDENGNIIYLPAGGTDYEKHEPEYYRDMVIQAMNELGISVTEDKVNRVIRQIATESGGDPLAIQHGYSDSNTYRVINGWVCPWCQTRSQYRSDGYTCENYDRAHGLMQTITSTFTRYKIDGHDDIYNPYDNLLAALNYIKNVYPDDFSGIGEGHGY